jgi:hypothetical protein
MLRRVADDEPDEIDLLAEVRRLTRAAEVRRGHPRDSVEYTALLLEEAIIRSRLLRLLAAPQEEEA